MAFHRKKTNQGSKVRITLADGSLSPGLYRILGKTTDSKERVELTNDNGSNVKVHYERIVADESGNCQEINDNTDTNVHLDDSVNPVTKRDCREMSTQVECKTSGIAENVADVTKKTRKTTSTKPAKVAAVRAPKKTKEEIIAGIPSFDFTQVKIKGLSVYVSETKPWGNYSMETIVLHDPASHRQQIFNLYNGRLSLSKADATINLPDMISGTNTVGTKQQWKVNEKFSEERLIKSGYKKIN